MQVKYQTKSVSEYLLTAGMVFLIIGAAATVLILSVHQDKSEQFPVPYLLPVSFYSGQVNDSGLDKIQAIMYNNKLSKFG
jgi:hypothetical protein